jgi:hypothetical protein
MYNFLLLLPLPIVLVPGIFFLLIGAWLCAREGFEKTDGEILLGSILLTALIPLVIWFLIFSEQVIYAWATTPAPTTVEAGH